MVSGPLDAVGSAVVYVPATVLQSTFASKESSANVIVYSVHRSPATTPWNAGTFSVMAVSCQVLPVRAWSPGLPWGTSGADAAGAALAVGFVEVNDMVPFARVSVSSPFAIL